MSGDESRHEHLPTEGGQFFAENGSETVENDQTGPEALGTLRDVLGDCISDNGYATTYDRIIQNIRSSVRGIIAMAGDLSEAEEERLEQVLERLSKAIEAQRRRPDQRISTRLCKTRHVQMR